MNLYDHIHNTAESVHFCADMLPAAQHEYAVGEF